MNENHSEANGRRADHWEGAELKAALAAQLPCLLCGGQPLVGAVFVPKEQRRVNAPPGKVRLVRYSLCLSCAQRSDIRTRVEERIFADCLAEARSN
jgi:hypothetical protein